MKRMGAVVAAVVASLAHEAMAEASFTSLWRRVGARAGDADPALFGFVEMGAWSRTAERQWFDLSSGAMNRGYAVHGSVIDEGSIVSVGEQGGFAERLGGEVGFGAGTEWIEADILVTAPTLFEMALRVDEIGARGPDELAVSLMSASGPVFAHGTAGGVLSGVLEEHHVLGPGEYQFRWMIQRGAISDEPLERSGSYELTVKIPAPGALGIVGVMGWRRTR